MPTNIEIKYRVSDLDAVEKQAISIADYGPELLVQEDVFFNASHGRLKLRKFDDGSAELIAYHRSDDDSVRESNWFAYPTNAPEDLQHALAMSLGQSVTVFKKRTLYKVGHTRIHLDRVEELGEFVELEVCLGDSDSPNQGRDIANALILKLGLDTQEPMSVAYADLLQTKK